MNALGWTLATLAVLIVLALGTLLWTEPMEDTTSDREGET